MKNSLNVNERYLRKHLRPIAKSVYQHRKVLRLNGSLNGAISNAGTGPLNINESAKALQNNNVQIAMTQTFNMSILNNSFNIGNRAFMAATQNGSGGAYGAGTIDTAVTSPRAIRSIATEAFAPFTIIPNAKIPDLSETRREEREERVQNLLRRPRHKEIFKGPGGETNNSQNDKLMSAPLTMEDKNQFINLPLINTLRDN
mmetsp:Transcript_9681/g.16284  ORF Transcript_9681/g.16284 Transcript_9681/m.16284 type:complete len:201 (-) Transcript_9681:850-1452(-)